MAECTEGWCDRCSVLRLTGLNVQTGCLFGEGVLPAGNDSGESDVADAGGVARSARMIPAAAI